MNEIFDYASSKPYIEKWSEDFQRKTGGKSFGNLRAMHNAVSAGKLISLEFDDENRAVQVCAKVIDDSEWEKVLEGVYTGFSFGGSAIRRWRDEEMNAARYTLQPNELSLADKPCVPSAVFEVVKTDGTRERRQFKTGGKKIVIKIEKNMDMTQFMELMQNVKEGLAADEKTPENLMAAVENLVKVLTECTGSAEPKENEEPVAEQEDKAVESGCPTEKTDIAAEVRKVFSPLAKSLEGFAGISEAVLKTAKSLEEMQKRLEKIESAPQAPKAFKLVAKADDGKNAPPTDPNEAVMAEIKKTHNFTTCAY